MMTSWMPSGSLPSTYGRFRASLRVGITTETRRAAASPDPIAEEVPCCGVIARPPGGPDSSLDQLDVLRSLKRHLRLHSGLRRLALRCGIYAARKLLSVNVG